MVLNKIIGIQLIGYFLSKINCKILEKFSHYTIIIFFFSEYYYLALDQAEFFKQKKF